MLSTVKRSLLLAAVVLAAAAAWFFWNAGSGTRTSSKTPSVPAMQVSSPPVAPLADMDIEVTIPIEDLDRLHLKFAKVTQQAINVEVRVPATVQANIYKQVHVTPLVGGVVMQVTAELGQTVKRGQTLVQIFSRELAEAQTSYVSFSAELEVEHKKLVRTEELVRLGAASRQELEEIEANHRVHTAHVEESRQKLLLLGLNEKEVADVAAGRQASTNILIPSPLDGAVTSRNVNLGQVVTAAQDLLTVTDLSSVWVEASLLENDFAAVSIGSQALITTPAYPGRQYRGAVSYIDPQVDPQTRTAKVRVEVDNPEPALRLGMYMDCLFANQAGATVPVVPKQAIQAVGPSAVVFLPVDGQLGHFLQRTVKTGEESSTGVRVLEGLRQGETVVTDGSFLLRAEAARQHP
jgi:membrane fusion protein, heavy metal efflux system